MPEGRAALPDPPCDLGACRPQTPCDAGGGVPYPVVVVDS